MRGAASINAWSDWRFESSTRSGFFSKVRRD